MRGERMEDIEKLQVNLVSGRIGRLSELAVRPRNYRAEVNGPSEFLAGVLDRHDHLRAADIRMVAAFEPAVDHRKHTGDPLMSRIRHSLLQRCTHAGMKDLHAAADGIERSELHDCRYGHAARFAGHLLRIANADHDRQKRDAQPVR